MHPSARIEALGGVDDATKGGITLYQCLDSFTKKEVRQVFTAWCALWFVMFVESESLWAWFVGMMLQYLAISQNVTAYFLFARIEDDYPSSHWTKLEAPAPC